MSEEEIKSNLCWYDPENPGFIFLDAEDIPKPRDNCYCDNCLYGRDKLAVLLLKAIEHSKAWEIIALRESSICGKLLMKGKHE